VYKIIKSNGTELEVVPKVGTTFSLKEMQQIVGGYIQFVYLDANEIMVCNEEGKLMNLPYNEAATKLLSGTDYEGDFICGDVLIADRKSIN
jgi:hypothetical protein